MSKRAAASAFSGYMHPLATGLLAWAISANAFPKAPRLFQEFAKNELFRYFLVFVLVYQGGAKQNVGMALMVTVGMFLLSKILDIRAVLNTLQAPLTPDPAVVAQMKAMAMAQAQAQAMQDMQAASTAQTSTTEGFCCSGGSGNNKRY